MVYLFCGKKFYPNGGARDHTGTFATAADALAFAEPLDFDWAHVANSDMQIIASWEALSEEIRGPHVYLNMGWKIKS